MTTPLRLRLHSAHPLNDLQKMSFLAIYAIGGLLAYLWLCAKSKESAESALGFLFCDLGALIIGAVFWPVVVPFLAIESKIQTAEKEGRKNKKENPPVDLSLLHGKIGITKTQQSPSGRIVIDDKEYESQSVHTHIEKGTTVRVVGHSMCHLKIEPADQVESGQLRSLRSLRATS